MLDRSLYSMTDPFDLPDDTNVKLRAFSETLRRQANQMALMSRFAVVWRTLVVPSVLDEESRLCVQDELDAVLKGAHDER